MPGKADLVGGVFYSLVNIDARIKWNTVQSRILHDFKDGILTDPDAAYEAVVLSGTLASGHYSPDELDKDMVDGYQSSVGNHVYANNSRVFDKHQLHGVEIVLNYSKAYDESIGTTSKGSSK